MGKFMAMKDRQELEQLSRDDLIALVVKLATAVETLQAEFHILRSEVQTLREENEALKRKGHRQTAPFSKGSRKADPKPPGRKKGEGPFTFRRAPAPDEMTEPPVDVPVSRSDCPACGGGLTGERVDFAYVTDLPVEVKPRVRQYRVSVCRCKACGARVRGEHPDLAPGQHGASAHRLGPRLKAAAHALHYGLGLPVRKVPEVLGLLCGVRVTQSALTQDALRQSERAMGEAYRALREGVKDAPRVNTDDTGWRIGGETAHLMAFATEDAVVYQIRERHRNEEVREVIPADYAGVMICDRGKSYDALPGVKQQKCLAHLLRALSDETETDPANGFAAALKERLGAAHRLWRAYRAGRLGRGAYDRAGMDLHRQITLDLVRERVQLHTRQGEDRSPPPPRSAPRDAVNRRLLEQVGGHHWRGNLLRFLTDPAIEPTNNRAERALRGAVIARKVSHCSKSERGAEAYAVFVSVIRTARQQGNPILDTLARLLHPRASAHAAP